MRMFFFVIPVFEGNLSRSIRIGDINGIGKKLLHRQVDVGLDLEITSQIIEFAVDKVHGSSKVFHLRRNGKDAHPSLDDLVAIVKEQLLSPLGSLLKGFLCRNHPCPDTFSMTNGLPKDQKNHNHDPCNHGRSCELVFFRHFLCVSKFHVDHKVIALHRIERILTQRSALR